MSNIQFVEVDADKIHREIINDFEAALNETLYPGDERRIFLDQQSQVIVGLKNDINETGKQNLLRYASGETLDALGEWTGTQRISAKKAQTTIKFTLSIARQTNTIIPSGTRVTPDGIIFFSTVSDLVIPAGSLDGYTIALANEVGEKFNNFISGQIQTLVDPIPYVASVVNTDNSAGGADVEDDDAYRERIRQAPEAISTAGSEESYSYWAKTADVNISDVAVLSPSPGEIDIIVLLKDGQLPSEDVLSAVSNACNQRDKRPITDNVKVSAPTIKNFDVTVTYYLDKQHETEEMSFKKAIQGDDLNLSSGAIREYINWQQEKLGRDLSPDELRFRIQNAALYNAGDNKYFTAIKRIELSYPNDVTVKENEIAKVNMVAVNYGGLE